MDTDGFFSEESEKFKAYYLSKYDELFSFVKEFNRFIIGLLGQEKIDWDDKRLLIIHTLFLRVVENYQSIVLLLERGVMSPAKVLARAMLENLFTLVALQKKPELINNYNDQYLDGRKRTLKAALQFKGAELRKLAKKNKIESMYVEIKKELSGKELNILKPKQWAVCADLEDFYNLYYVIYSNYTHSNLSALDDHFDLTEDSMDLAFGPSDKDLCDIASCSNSTLELAVHYWGIAHGKDLSKQLSYFKNKYLKMDVS